MPAGRVLATQLARDAAKQLLALTGTVKEKVGRVLQQGNVLADPNHWGGGLAGKWRNDWGPDTNQLNQAAAKLDELERRAQQVVEDIFKADSAPPGATTSPGNAGRSGGGGGGGGGGGRSLWQNIVHYAEYIPLEAASSATYGVYYGAYQGLKYWNKLPAPLRVPLDVVGFPIKTGLVGMEALGLGGDVTIDLVKNAVLHNGESWKDEGMVGPLFGNGLKRLGFDPFDVYLPGVHPNGAIDWEWW